jgi:hypothetical protein
VKNVLISSLVALFIGSASLLQTTSAVATTFWVNDDALTYSSPGTGCTNADYAAISAAILAASQDDNINVCPGTYTENVLVNKNGLTITSTGGASVTTVHAAISFYVFQITATGVTIEGLTIVPAGFADGDIGINVSIEGDTGLTLSHNVVLGGRIGVNLGCASFGSELAHNTLSGQTEAGINVDTCEIAPFPGSHDNSIHHNIACSVTSTASIALGGSSNDNDIHHNVATSISVYGTGNDVHHNRTQLVIIDNGSGNNLHHNSADPSVCT